MQSQYQGLLRNDMYQQVGGKGKYQGYGKRNAGKCLAAAEPLLLRVAKGEDGERTPVWLMRQAGRYMAEFREYSNKYPFRHRSETPEIAIELSLQPWRAFQTDGVIMFSDILTPLPAMGIEFDVIKGKGPVISTPVRSMDDVKKLTNIDDPQKQLPFINTILSSLRKEVDGQSTLLGFIGTPWTLAAYSIESAAERHCTKTKTMMHSNPEILHAFLQHLTKNLADYVCYQIDSGAQVVQLFDSWAHHLSPKQYAEFSGPYSDELMRLVREKRPGVPLILHANGGVGKVDQLNKSCSDVVSLDWQTSMKDARQIVGPERVLQGNVDPTVLLGSEQSIKQAVQECLSQAGKRHILNLGHGVMQPTPEESVALFCDLAKQS